MKLINGIETIIDKYDLYLLDQWGVIHNGVSGYPKAIKAIDYLINKNKKIIIISNSSKKKQSTIQRLPKLGFKKENFFDVLTSGQMIWNEISNFLFKYGKNLHKCFHIYDNSKEDGLDFRKGLDKLKFVKEIEKSDFILACTPFNDSKPVDYIPLLKIAIDKNLKMFCANPDYETIEKDQNKSFCMGTIAKIYENMGGEVIILGKPANIIYLEAIKSLKINKSKILAVGDSIFHDIEGANKFGIDSLFITTGIHSDMFSQINPVWTGSKNKLQKYNIKPTYFSLNFSI